VFWFFNIAFVSLWPSRDSKAPRPCHSIASDSSRSNNAQRTGRWTDRSKRIV
jgi:hypothetical protein